jgi:hypothetical protein
MNQDELAGFRGTNLGSFPILLLHLPSGSLPRGVEQLHLGLVLLFTYKLGSASIREWTVKNIASLSCKTYDIWIEAPPWVRPICSCLDIC